MQGQRRPGRAAVEPRPGYAPGARADGNDVNRERLVFCLTSIVGHWVIAKLRGNVVYEGLFHSCSLDGDYSITLKLARRLSADSCSRNGELVQTLIIPGKDFLQVSAVDLPPPTCEELSTGIKGSVTDAEITASQEPIGEHKLVPWSNGVDGAQFATALEESRTLVNRDGYGTLNPSHDDEVYTVKVDKSTISLEQKKRADRIAREMMSGQAESEVEGKVKHDDVHEETRFASVHKEAENNERHEARHLSGSGCLGAGEQREQAPAAKAPTSAAVDKGPVSQLPLVALSGHETLPSLTDPSLLRDLRSKRGMISEMKRINALNLEPTLPKPDEGPRSSKINFAESQGRQLGVDLKSEFQQSLAHIQKQEEARHRRRQQQVAGGGGAPEHQGGQTGTGVEGGWQAGGPPLQHQQQQQQQQPQQQQQRRSDSAIPQVGGHPPADQSREKFSFNPQAKAFSLNPQAGEFMPGDSAGSNPGGGGGGSTVGSAPTTAPSNAASAQKAVAVAPQKPAEAPVVPFMAPRKNPSMLRKNLDRLLEPFFQMARRYPSESGGPEWPEARGPTYREVHGQPNPAHNRNPAMDMLPAGGMRGHPVNGPDWQQGPPAPEQAMQAPLAGTAGHGIAAAPQMMQQGFVGANAPTAGPPVQMYSQMYAAPGGQGPQGTQCGGCGMGGCMPQGGGGNMGGSMSQGGVPQGGIPQTSMPQGSMQQGGMPHGGGGMGSIPQGGSGGMGSSLQQDGGGGMPGAMPQGGGVGNMGGGVPQGQQAQVVFGQQTMMAQQGPSQGMALPMGMSSMPKFGGQQQQQPQMVVMPIMMAPGQYQHQSFVPQQAIQGQQGPTGPPGPLGQGDGQQAQIMLQAMYGHRTTGTS